MASRFLPLADPQLWLRAGWGITGKRIPLWFIWWTCFWPGPAAGSLPSPHQAISKHLKVTRQHFYTTLGSFWALGCLGSLITSGKEVMWQPAFVRLLFVVLLATDFNEISRNRWELPNQDPIKFQWCSGFQTFDLPQIVIIKAKGACSCSVEDFVSSWPDWDFIRYLQQGCI